MYQWGLMTLGNARIHTQRAIGVHIDVLCHRSHQMSQNFKGELSRYFALTFNNVSMAQHDLARYLPTMN